MAHKNKSNISPYKTRQAERLNEKSNEKQTPNHKSVSLNSLAKQGKHKKPLQIFDVEQANDRLYDLFRNHEFSDVPHLTRKTLAQFYVLLMQTQEKENFTRLVSIKDVGIRHFIDCMMVPRLTDLQFPLMDLGTGPGFPGIPLKILYPNAPIFLAEGVQRRVEFLKKVRDELNLQELYIVGRNINPYFAYPMQSVITRAVEDIGNTLTNVSTCLQTGGRVYFMKGPNVDPELEALEKDPNHKLLKEHYVLEKNIHYFLPKTPHERRLLVFKKIKAFPWPDFDLEFPDFTKG